MSRASDQAEPRVEQSRYVNREWSWLQFNRRVLAESSNPSNPLLERLKFLAIFESNLDEFYMVRVSGLIEQEAGQVSELSPDGLSASDQLALISDEVKDLREEASRIWLHELQPALAEENVGFLTWEQLTEEQRVTLQATFRRDVFPLCTPILLHPNPSVPFISNRSLNLAVKLMDPESGTMIGRVKVPSVVPRAVEVSRGKFILLEDLLVEHLKDLFPGVRILGSWKFRVIRDADIEIRELEASDLIASIEETLRRRRFGDPVMLEIDASMPKDVADILLDHLELDESDSFQVKGLMGLDVLWQLASLPRASLRFPPHTPAQLENIPTGKELFDAIAKRDLLVHHPYDSFRLVDEFVASAAKDPDVLGIKMTLYRVGAESPIVESLLAAAEKGKQVAVMVELKARFDENNNLIWARALERAGVHVSYGFTERKVHCKLALVVRREGKRVRSYVHVGTGNFNPNTARIYTDIGLFTAREAIAADVSELFNSLTGFSRQTGYRELLVSPFNVRDGILEQIEKEIEIHRLRAGGHIIFKLNSLVDPEVIDKLYQASQAGVKIDLIVRGISCIRPGVKGLSENIQVRSIVGRFLEHARIYYFEGDGQRRAYIGSADMMRRNLDRRVEVLSPVVDPKLVDLLRNEVLAPQLEDTLNAWIELSDGSYVRAEAPPGRKPMSSQAYGIKHPLGPLQFGRSTMGRPRVSRR